MYPNADSVCNRENEVKNLHPLAGALAAASIAAFASPAFSQSVYKCVKDGKTTFQESPCDGSNVIQSKVAGTAARLPWEGIRDGMTRDEVKRIAAIQNPPGQGAKGKLRKKGVVISGVAFIVDYTFDANERWVSMLAQPEQGSSDALHMDGNDANFSAYEKVAAYLRGKYGTERNRSLKNKDTGFPGLSASSDWVVGGGKLFVTVIPVTATTSSLHLGYQFPGRDRR